MKQLQSRIPDSIRIDVRGPQEVSAPRPFEGRDSAYYFRLADVPEIRIGKLRGVGRVPLDAEGVADVHAVIEVVRDPACEGLYLMSRKPRSPLKLNGRDVTVCDDRLKISHGDIIEIGPFDLQIFFLNRVHEMSPAWMVNELQQQLAEARREVVKQKAEIEETKSKAKELEDALPRMLTRTIDVLKERLATALEALKVADERRGVQRTVTFVDGAVRVHYQPPGEVSTSTFGTHRDFLAAEKSDRMVEWWVRGQKAKIKELQEELSRAEETASFFRAQNQVLQAQLDKTENRNREHVCALLSVIRVYEKRAGENRSLRIDPAGVVEQAEPTEFSLDAWIEKELAKGPLMPAAANGEEANDAGE